MTAAPILLPDVPKRSEATSRPQNFPRKHLSPKINTDQGGFEPPTIACNRLGRTLRLQRQRLIQVATGPVAKKGPSIPAPTKSHQPPQHSSTLKEKERPRHFRLLPHVGAEKLARAIQHTAVARNRAALATSLLVETPLQTHKWLHAFIVVTIMPKAAKPMGCLPD